MSTGRYISLALLVATLTLVVLAEFIKRYTMQLSEAAIILATINLAVFALFGKSKK